MSFGYAFIKMVSCGSRGRPERPPGKGIHVQRTATRGAVASTPVRSDEPHATKPDDENE